jgi:hypothetical protein
MSTYHFGMTELNQNKSFKQPNNRVPNPSPLTISHRQALIESVRPGDLGAALDSELYFDTEQHLTLQNNIKLYG